MEYNRERADSAAWTLHRRWPVRRRGGVPLIVAVAAVAFALSACGAEPASPGIASAGSSSTTTTTAPTGLVSGAGLAYAECMRSHGVPNFPDPNASGGFALGAGIDPQSAAFKSAQAACQKFIGGLSSPGTTTHPSEEVLAQMLRIARCMRRHGISDFPDPITSMPSNVARFQYVSDRDGVILAFPRGFDDQSPQFTAAAAACGFKLTNR